MKLLILALVAVLIVVPVLAELTEEDVENAVRRVVQEELKREDDEEEMEARDSRVQCNGATNYCNGHGICMQNSRGNFRCVCQDGYVVAGPHSTCIPQLTREMEMELRDSESRCMRDTQQCNGHGTCAFRERFDDWTCSCDEGYTLAMNGGCVEKTQTRELLERLFDLLEDE